MKKIIVFIIAIICIGSYLEIFAMEANEVMSTSAGRRDGGGNECYKYVVNIMQTRDNNCAMTNVVEVLYGIGAEGEVAGNTPAEKIATIEAAYGLNGKSPKVYQVVDALNRYIPGRTTYQYTEMTSKTIDEFETMIANSLTYGKPVILHAVTTPLSYYGGNRYYHYICIDYINRTTNRVRIVDCIDDPLYYGIHYVDLEEAYNAVHIVPGRYIIH